MHYSCSRASYEDGNDSFFHRAVEPDPLIEVR